MADWLIFLVFGLLVVPLHRWLYITTVEGFVITNSSMYISSNDAFTTGCTLQQSLEVILFSTMCCMEISNFNIYSSRLVSRSSCYRHAPLCSNIGWVFAIWAVDVLVWRKRRCDIFLVLRLLVKNLIIPRSTFFLPRSKINREGHWSKFFLMLLLPQCLFVVQFWHHLSLPSDTRFWQNVQDEVF